MDSTNSNRIELTTPVQFLKGVGPAKAKAFAKMDVDTVADLIEYFPRNYNFVPDPTPIKDCRPNQETTIIALVEQTDFQPSRYRKMPAMFKVTLADETGLCHAVWFHGAYLQDKLEPGQVIMATGKFTIYKHQLQMTNPKFIILDSEQTKDVSSLGGAVYPASAKLTTGQIKYAIKPLIEKLPDLVPEFYTDKFREKTNLITRSQALVHIHSPEDAEQLIPAKRRLKYDELFLMQLGLALKRYRVKNYSPAMPMKHTNTIDTRIKKRFPFLLTPDQEVVIKEIVADMTQPIPMNRLVQGDVGSGKTVVALYAALLAIANKTQAVIMAPTEILANQHMISIERFLKGSRVRRELVTGALTGKKRTEIIERINSHQVDIVVGTVALLNDDIKFENLGIVIIDEQHKFGVHQRAGLTQLKTQNSKLKTPHRLVMTATPIPRTLAMTAFGDLDVSTIKNRPPGRSKVITRWVQPHNRTPAFEFIRKQLNEKKQAYFVYPRIDSDPEDTDLKAAAHEYKILSEKIFPEFNIELLHGQMKSDQKQDIMDRFRRGKIDALVSTVVIEVGLDVPNATMMIIEGANRFGLAQLHQLRGRIGRPSPGKNNGPSYCMLFANTEDETAISRLEIMIRTDDGFEISEHDLKLRGPGELFSARQHGIDDLKIANIIDDFDLLTLARRNAVEMVNVDPMLNKPENRNIRKELIKKFGEKIALVDVA